MNADIPVRINSFPAFPRMVICASFMRDFLRAFLAVPSKGLSPGVACGNCPCLRTSPTSNINPEMIVFTKEIVPVNYSSIRENRFSIGPSRSRYYFWPSDSIFANVGMRAIARAKLSMTPLYSFFRDVSCKWFTAIEALTRYFHDLKGASPSASIIVV